MSARVRVTCRLAAVAAAVWLASLLAAPLLPAPPAAAIYAIGSLICHQRPDRSFDLAGAQLPVCARCLGLYAGVLIGAVAVPVAGRFRYPRLTVVLAVAPALTSLMVEWAGWGTPSNGVRAGTGLIAGVLIAAVVLATLHYEECARPRPIAPNPPPTPI